MSATGQSRRFRTWLSVGLAVVVVWVFGYRLAEWLLTGQIYVTTSLQPAHYVAYADDPTKFVVSFLFSVIMVGLGLTEIFRVALDQ
jgi:uncharacterized protein (DUF2062 family)